MTITFQPDVEYIAARCACCSQPTGEMFPRGGMPSLAYCDGCRNLPGTYNRDGQERGGPVRNREGTTEAHDALRQVLATTGALNFTAGANWTTTLITPPEDDEYPEDDEDENPVEPCCAGCGGTRFCLVETGGRRYRNFDTTNEIFHDGDGTMVNLCDADYGEEEYDGDSWVECNDCARRYNGRWEY